MDPMALNLMQTYNTQKMFLNSKSSFFCLTESFPLHRLSFYPNLTKIQDSYSNIHENYLKNLLNFKELTLNKNPDYSAKDPYSTSVTDPPCFIYYLNHEFNKLNKTTTLVRMTNSHSYIQTSVHCRATLISLKCSLVTLNIMSAH